MVDQAVRQFVRNDFREFQRDVGQHHDVLFARPIGVESIPETLLPGAVLMEPDADNPGERQTVSIQAVHLEEHV